MKGGRHGKQSNLLEQVVEESQSNNTSLPAVIQRSMNQKLKELVGPLEQQAPQMNL